MKLKEIRDNHTGLLSDKYDNYLKIYEEYFDKLQPLFPAILEIGVQNGGNLEIMDEYFGHRVLVHGVDINPDCLKIKDTRPDFDIKILDGSDPLAWKEYLSQYDGFDLVIEDASHLPTHQITTFEEVFPKVNPGGFYICEDIWTSYGDIGSFINYMKDKIDLLNEIYCEQREIPFKDSGIVSMHWYQSMVVVERGLPERLKRTVVGNDWVAHPLDHVRNAPPGSDSRFI